MIPVYLAVSMVTGFNNIHSLVYNIYYLNKSNNKVQATLKRWLYEYGHREVAFDCGYFMMGFSLPVSYTHLDVYKRQLEE